MKIGVLTSSRADYSIYFPLLKALKDDPFFQLSIIVFGTHASEKHGYTVNKIEEDGFAISSTLITFPLDDTPEAVARAMGVTTLEFAEYWKNSIYDVVFCLGDRYEMFAACASAMPFNLKLAHIHGGEQTIGAIDDSFRHSITHMSTLHFTSAEPYRERVIRLKESPYNVYNVGSLSIDNLKTLRLLSIEEFKKQFNIDLRVPTILITFHPETVSYEKNEDYIITLISALQNVEDFQYVITMPNADTMGNVIRKHFNQFIERSPRAIGVESLGTVGYLSCMKYCSLMLGNTSSGFIEASFFPKYVINLGDRQRGRIVTPNIRNTPIEKEKIIEAIRAYNPIEKFAPVTLYGEGNTTRKIIDILKTNFKES